MPGSAPPGDGGSSGIPHASIRHVIEVLMVLQRETGKLVDRVGDYTAGEGREVLNGPGCSGGLIDAVHIVSDNVVDIDLAAGSGRVGNNLLLWRGAFRLLRQVRSGPLAVVSRSELHDVTVFAGDEVNAHLLGAGNDERAKVGKPGCRRGLGERRQIFISPRCIVVEKLMNVVVGGEVIDILEVANIKSSHAVTRGRDRASGNCCQIRVLPIGPVGGEKLVNVGVDTGVVDVQGR